MEWGGGEGGTKEGVAWRVWVGPADLDEGGELKRNLAGDQQDPPPRQDAGDFVQVRQGVGNLHST